MLTPPILSFHLRSAPWLFAGGIIVEFYQASACGLLTYLVVKKSCRGQLRVAGKDTNVASILLHHPDAMPHLVAQMRATYGHLSAVLFESNHPSRTLLEDDSMPPH